MNARIIASSRLREKVSGIMSWAEGMSNDRVEYNNDSASVLLLNLLLGDDPHAAANNFKPKIAMHNFPFERPVPESHEHMMDRLPCQFGGVGDGDETVDGEGRESRDVVAVDGGGEM